MTIAPKAKVATIPQYCEAFYEKKADEAAVAQLSARFGGGFNVVFTGNISPAQDLPVLIAAAAVLKKRGLQNINYIIVGDGMERKNIEALCLAQQVQDVFYFEGAHAATDMPQYFAIASCLVAGLVDTEDVGLTIPAKIASYLAGAKPVVAHMNGAGAAVIAKAQCGLVGAAGDAQTLANNIETLYNMNGEQRAALAKNGFTYYRQHFEREKVLGDIINFMFN